MTLFAIEFDRQAAYDRPRPFSAVNPKSKATKTKTGEVEMPVVPAITIYVVLVWLLWGFFMAIGWALGTWIMGQILAGVWRPGSPRPS
jgi:hypothetical protein